MSTVLWMVGLPGYPSTILLHGSSEEGVRSPRLVTAIFKPAAKFPVVGIALISAVAVGVVAQVEQVRRVFESKTSEGGLLRYEARGITFPCCWFFARRIYVFDFGSSLFLVGGGA